jgi:uncharacterized protein
MTAAFGAIAVAALAGTPHCMGMCGALAAAGSGRGGWLPYHLGRIATYATLGGLAGGFGASIPGPPWLGTAISGVLLVGFSAALAGWLPEPKIRIPGLAKAGAWLSHREGSLPRFGFGVVNGLLPCGLLYATLAIPVSSGSAVAGALLMALFGTLTAAPLTVAVLGFRKVLYAPRMRTVTAGLVLIGGLYSLSQRGGWLLDNPPPSCH